MTWNYRIVGHGRGDTFYVGLHEVYYNKKGKPYLWNAQPVMTADHRLDAIETLSMMMRDACKMDAKILHESEMPGAKKRMKQKPLRPV